MKPHKEQIDRMGWEAWADNLLVNTIENLPADATAMACDHGDVSVKVSLVGKDVVGFVRAYVHGYGWKHHERTIRRACYSN